MRPTYIFILCPPYCGSSLIWELLATSANLSALPGEGHFIPEVEKVMRTDMWNPHHKMPWAEIKDVWHTYWDAQANYLLEKSPENLVRALDIRDHFQPVRFLVSVRNPYAHCHSLLKRTNWKLADAARFSLMCLATQARNLDRLPPEERLLVRYEDITSDTDSATARIHRFLPNLKKLNTQKQFSAHRSDHQTGGVQNLNPRKIEQLSSDQLETISCVLKNNTPLLERFGYALIETQNPPPRSQPEAPLKTVWQDFNKLKFPISPEHSVIRIVAYYLNNEDQDTAYRAFMKEHREGLRFNHITKEDIAHSKTAAPSIGLSINIPEPPESQRDLVERIHQRIYSIGKVQKILYSHP